MEQIGNTLAQLQTQIEERKKAHHDNTICSHHAFNTSLQNVEHNVYEMIPKKDYAILLDQLEEWGVGSPKAVCRIYGVKTVQRAVAYVKGTPNVRCKGAYFTYMVRQLKSEQVTGQVQNLAPQSATPKEIEKKEEVIAEKINPSEKRTQPPEIKSPLQANIFLCDFEEGRYEKTAEIIDFVRQIKRKYNFG